MRKTQKKIVGLFGLVLVVAMTIVAAFLPSPGVSAVSTLTDHITVVVVGSEPSASITSPDSGDKFLTPEHEIVIDYNNIKNYKIIVTYTDINGVETTATYVEENAPGEHGPTSYDFRTMAETYGYGRYIVKLEAVGDDDSLIEDAVEFEYIAIEAEPSKDEDTGKTYVDLDFDQDQDSLTDDLKIDYVIINVYDEDGNLVDTLSPIMVKPPVGQVEIPFDEDVPAGTYTLVVQPYNQAGEALFDTVVLTVTFDGKEADIVVPDTADTGGLFKNLNISRADYLITGIGVFLVVGIGSIIYMNKRGKTNKRRK